MEQPSAPDALAGTTPVRPASTSTLDAIRASDVIGRLAILVVYYLVDDSDLPLVSIHLDRIAQHTAVPYTIYATAERCPEAGRELLRSRSEVRVCSVTRSEARGSREHSVYLDALMRVALEDPEITHICTLDVDSFPVADRWLDHLLTVTPPASGLAGVLRLENGDTALPHPSCILATRAFFERFRPSFSPDAEHTAEYRKFIRSTGQAADTGIRVGSVLWNHRLPWGHVLRTNVENPHYLMAGIYGDIVFHLGGVGRKKLFRQDLMRARSHRISRRLGRLPAGGSRAVGLLKRRMNTRARDAVAAEVSSTNRRINKLIREWLFDDIDELIAYLRGQRVSDRAQVRAAELSRLGHDSEVGL